MVHAGPERQGVNEKKSGYCFLCGHKFDDVAGFTECPECKTKAMPCLYENEARVWINWKELLAIIGSAEKAADKNPGFLMVVHRIAKKLEEQEPKRPPLSSSTFAKRNPPESSKGLAKRFFGDEVAREVAG